MKAGAELRTEYKDFYDIQTEYDTINLADATWSSAGQNTLSKEVTDYFAHKVLECGKAADADVQFAYFLLQGREAADYRILTDYIRRRTGGDAGDGRMDTGTAFHRLEDILDGIRRGTSAYRPDRTDGERRMIVWD